MAQPEETSRVGKGTLLLVHGTVANCQPLARALTLRGHTVAAVTLAEAAAGRGSNADVVLLAEPIAAKALAALVRDLRSRARSKRLHIVAVLAEPPSGILLALEAGIDDFVRMPYAVEELLARIELPAILARTRRTSGVQFDWSGRLNPTQTSTWKGVRRLTQAEIAQLAGSDLDVQERDGARRETINVKIPLTLATDGLEILVRMRLAVDSARALAGTLFGTPSPERALLDDLAKEAVNTVAGAFKRAASDDGLILTLGLPALDDCVQRPVLAAEEFACVGANSGFAADLMFHLMEQATRKVPASALREGMVVVRDLSGATGALLLPAGTRLTSSAAARVSQHVGDKVLIEVAEAS